MIVDLHAHFPMHLDPTVQGRALALMTDSHRGSFRDKLRARVLDVASRIANYRSWHSGPAVTVPSLREGGVGVALSVLYSPFDEMDLSEPYGSPPKSHYFPSLIRQLDLVEHEVATHSAAEAGIARNVAELDALIAQNKVALVHAVEGGFHLGAGPDEIAANVAALAERGVAYVTVAHLFWRGIATNAPALPFLPDAIYKLLFPQPREGLVDLGYAAVRAMVARGVLVDVTHMDAYSLSETFDELDRLNPARDVPVIASHIACRIGRLEYNLDDASVVKIAKRGGVMGVILCDHYAADGIRKRTETFEQSMTVIRRQIDRIAELTGSHDHAAIGTDLDGFIKPTLHGLDDARHLKRLEEELERHYGAAVAEKVCSGNALRVLREHWLRPR